MDNEEKTNKEWLTEFAKFLLLLVVSFIVFKFILMPFRVCETSMYPTLHDGDRIFLNGLDRDVKKNDIIIFKENIDGENIALIKRVAATEGDKIKVTDGNLYINGKKTAACEGDEEYAVPKGKCYVLGDNRKVSRDSREFGPIDNSSIKGTVLIRIWPIYKIGGVK